MKAAKLLFSAAASSALAGTATAQLPVAGGLLPGGLPAGSPLTAPPPPNALGIAPQPAPPGGNTIWQMLGLSQQQREFRRRQLCLTPAGGLIARIQAPISTLSGGLIRPFCPATPSLTELLDPGAIGAAAKVKQDRAGAEQRIKAVKYLGTVDCHYWPEAEEALIGALRNDRNECVRYEAAVVLANGCCCTPKIIAALGHAVSCSDADGAPSEKSPRVRAAAAVALERCLTLSCGAGCGPDCATGVPEAPVAETKQEGEKEKSKESEKEKEKEKDKPMSRANSSAPGTAKAGPPRDSREPLTMKEYYDSVSRLSKSTVFAFGRKSLEYGAQIGYATGPDVNAVDYVAAGLPLNATPQSISNPNNLSDVIASRSVPSMAQPNIVPVSSLGSVPSTVTPANLAVVPPTAMPVSNLAVVPQNATPVMMSQPLAPTPTPAVPLTLAGPSRTAPPATMHMDMSSPINATSPYPIPERQLSVIPASRPTQSKPPVTVMPWPASEPKKLDIQPIPTQPSEVRPATPSVAPITPKPSGPSTTSSTSVAPAMPTTPTVATTPAMPSTSTVATTPAMPSTSTVATTPSTPKAPVTSSVASTLSVIPPSTIAATPVVPTTPITPKPLSVTPEVSTAVPAVPSVPVTNSVKPTRLPAPQVVETLPAPEVVEAPVVRIQPVSATAPIVDSTPTVKPTPAVTPTPIPAPIPLSANGLSPVSRPAASPSMLPGPVPMMPGTAMTRPMAESPVALPGPVPVMPGTGAMTRPMAESPAALPGPVPVNPVTTIPASNLPPVETLRPRAMTPPMPVSFSQATTPPTVSEIPPVAVAPVVTVSQPVTEATVIPTVVKSPEKVVKTSEVVTLPVSIPTPEVTAPKVVTLPVSVPTPEVTAPKVVTLPLTTTTEAVKLQATMQTEAPAPMVTRAQESTPTPLPVNVFDPATASKPTSRKGFQDPKPVTSSWTNGQSGITYYPTQWSPNPANK